jgi:hypothetical protein
MKKTTVFASLAFAGLLGASNGEVIYEGFDYPTGTLSTESGGTWSGNATVSTPGLTYGDLATAGNTAAFIGQAGSFSVGTSLDGLLDHGDTLWFSVLINVGSIGTNPDFAFALGNGVLRATNNVPMSASETGYGLRVKNNLSATSWNNGPSGGTTQTITAATTYLVAGEMIFNADNALADTINLYLPGTDLTLGSVVSTIAATLDQTVFDTISFANKSQTTGDFVDEIRFGTSYADVAVAVPEPGTFALISGCLALTSIMLRRRRD